MSKTLPATTSCSNFQSVFNAALKAYEKQTKKDLLAHPLAAQLQACKSPGAILEVLHEKVQEFDQSQNEDERLARWLNPTVNVLCAFSAALGEGVGLVFSPAKVIFAGVGVLLLAAKDVAASRDALVDLFERIENFFKRLEMYIEVPPTTAMTDIIVKIMVEVLSILAIATKEIKQGRTKKYIKKLVGRTDIEDALTRLDKLTHEEARMATAQVLKATHELGVNVNVVDNKVQGVNDKVKILIDDSKDAKAIMQQTANKLDEEKRNQLQLDLRTWLCPPNPSTNHNIACSAHHEGTAEWFFKGSIFKEWKSFGSLLWIHGKPGSGKSILCSALIQDIMALRDAGLASMAYFYCDFRDSDKQSRRNLLNSLLIQLSARSDLCCDILSRIYSSHDKGAQKPNEDVLIQCLKDMLSLHHMGPIYIIVDALDECPNTLGIPSPREQVLQLVKELVSLHHPNLHLCVTSRPEVDIRATLEPLAPHAVSLHDQNGQKQDIVDYVRSVVYSDSEIMMKRWRAEDKNLVIETLSERADGMFRWVFCQLEVLRHCFPPSVRRFLDELPDSLDETYERVLKEIKKTNREHAHRLLQCVAVAVRPLRVEELAEVLAVDFDDAEGIPKLNPDWRWEDQEQAVISACSSLITVVQSDGSSVVQFSHFSVKEFLTSDRLANSSWDVSRYWIVLERAHTIVAQSCLGVLLCLDGFSDKDMVKRFPLAEYAAQYWVNHAQFENVSSRIEDGMKRLFDPDRPHFENWVSVYNIDFCWGDFGKQKGEPVTPLYHAALCGLYDLAEHLILMHPHLVNAKSGLNKSPLVAAVNKKYFKVAELLHLHGAVVDVRGFWNRTPLHEASVTGGVEIVQWLLDHGADVNSQQESDHTPLHLAAVHGHLEVSGILIKHNASINTRDDKDRTPLHRASECYRSETDYASLVRLLLEHGADTDVRDKSGSTPLHRASSVEVVRLLLEHGADVDAKDNEGETPSQEASRKERVEIVQLLSERHAG